MIAQTYKYTNDNQYDERLFVLSLKEEYINKMTVSKKTNSEQLPPDVVKLDFERLADYIRFEALKKHKFLTIDKIREILE